jgi:very-short-patch-repair endonuclease
MTAHPSIVRRARALRRDATDAERLLWRHLRHHGAIGAKFRRQHPVPPYVADFCCVAARLVVEVDGGQHTADGDAWRTAQIERQGYAVLRFWNTDVLTNIDGVLETIAAAVAARLGGRA